MRICVIAGTFHPEPGGPSTYLYHLLPALAERGHTVSVITYGEPGDGDPTFYPYQVTRLTRRVSILRRLLAFTREVLRQGHNADLLFVSDYGLPAALANLWLRKPMAIKIVADFAWEFASRRGWTTLSVMDFQKASHNLRTRLLRWLQGWYARRASTVIVPSQHVGRLVAGWGIPTGKIRVIYNALPGNLAEIPSKEISRRELGWPLEDCMLVTVGRLAEVKRVDLQLRALAKLPKARLVIVGDGLERESLRRLADDLNITDRVSFMGVLDHDKALRAIRAADIFLLSSRTEGLSHVLLEAMQLGTPCTATAVGGNPELITDGVDGILIPFGDVDALVEAICRLLDDPAQRSLLAAAAAERMKQFSWESLIHRTEAVLQEAAGD